MRLLGLLAPEGRVVEFGVTNPSGQINMMKGVVEISTGAYEDKVFGIPGMEKYRHDPDVEFTFLERRPQDKVIDPRVAPYIKLFLRDDTGGEKLFSQAQQGLFCSAMDVSFIKKKIRSSSFRKAQI